MLLTGTGTPTSGLGTPMQRHVETAAADWPFVSPAGRLEAGAYGVLLADPPWSYVMRSPDGYGKAPQSKYDCMSLEEIRALPVGRLAAKDAVCMLWAVFPMLPQALDVLAAWGFDYATGGAWAKQSSTGAAWAFGTGYIYRGAAEIWLLGKRGRPRPKNRRTRNLIAAAADLVEAPVRGHSVKPAQQHDMLEALFDGPYAELFARTRETGHAGAPPARPGWDVWGRATEGAP